jgi:hypothetical protein
MEKRPIIEPKNHTTLMEVDKKKEIKKVVVWQDGVI